MPGNRLNSQSREMVIHLLAYFQKEKENGGPLESVNSVQERVAIALNISKRTVCSIKREKIENPVLSSPGKKRPRIKTKTTDMPETLKMKIRDCLYNMYKDSNNY
ncbi:hypothetical protein RN001_008670 [Aquatica leii]|uniref:Uncharacterized protein n=1 Tax=Aquatica leii TaxID=1421715 RepID=A0AAN7PAL5_9COLE|nr:hypothetical protein RN001_008670 [Aquatica leii]